MPASNRQIVRKARPKGPVTRDNFESKTLPLRALEPGEILVRTLTKELGFDAAINYKTEDVGARLAEACPRGIDVFFDNVGGRILDDVLARIALRGRVVLCGAISQYENLDNAYGPKNYVNLIARRGRMEGFIILDYVSRFMEGVMALGGLLAEGKLKHKTTVVDGLDNAPEALRRLFTGDHDGNLLVKVANAYPNHP